MRQSILLAEDNEDDVVLFQHRLHVAKILNPLQIVTDGEEVIAYLCGEGKYADRTVYPVPIVLFLDLRMPKIDGYQILSFLQTNTPHPNLPVIVLSVLGELKDMAEAYLRGAKSFLVKPVAAHEILETLRAIPTLTLEPENEGFVLLPKNAPASAEVIPPKKLS